MRVVALGCLSLGVANCSSPKVAGGRSSGVDPKYGVSASPRLYGENDVIPKGGGRDLVGRPYAIAGKTYVPQDNPRGYSREGLASWYGTAFHGRMTANGEVFDRMSIAAAHPTLPLPSYARVTNLANGHSMIVRVNDRGPYHEGRLVDVSEQVAEALSFRRAGTTRVRLDYVGRASKRGSDDMKLLATLRTDGRPAVVPGRATTMFAEAGEDEAVRPVLAARSVESARPEPRPEPVRTEPMRAEPVRVATAEAEDDEPAPVTSIPVTSIPRSPPAPRAAAAPAPLPQPVAAPKSAPLYAPSHAPLHLASPPLRIVDAPLPPERPVERGRGSQRLAGVL